MGSPRKYSDDDCEGGSARFGHSRKDVTDTGFNNGSVKSCLIDLHVKSNRSLQSGLTNGSAFKIHCNGCAANLCAPTLDTCVNEVTAALPNTHLSCSGKPCKDSSSLGADKEMLKDNSDKGEFKTSEFCDNQQDQKPVYEKKERASEVRDQEKCGSNLAKTKKDIISHKPEPSILQSKAHRNYDEMRSSMKFDAEKTPNHLVSTFKGEKSQCLDPFDGEKNEMCDWSQHHQGTDMSSLSTDASASSLLKELPSKKADSQKGASAIMSIHTISNEHRIKNQDASSPLRRDGSSDAARNAIKEARNLKHLADRLKKSTGSSESTKFYFEAALKFLHGASLLESGKAENARHADMAESMEIYNSTAKLCAFCAREYERSRDMATAALAYKCMEVAYMRVICISHQSANKDQHELQTVLRIVPPGESPSSSASDIDSLNNSVSGGKAPLARSGESARLAADLVITAGDCPNFERFLSFAQNVNLAMEASRKSRIAFTAANVSMDQLGSKEGITSVKRALDFNFHDVDGTTASCAACKGCDW